LVAAGNLVLEFVIDVEVILDGALAAAGNDGHAAHAGIERFFNAILNQRLVDDWQHFLGHRFRGGEKARAVTGSREQALVYRGMLHVGLFCRTLLWVRRYLWVLHNLWCVGAALK